MRQLIYGVNPTRNIGVRIIGNTILLDAFGKVYHAAYPVSVEDVPKEHIDVLVWMTFYGLGVNRIHNGIEVPDCYDADREPLQPTGKKALLCYSAGADSTAVLLATKSIPVMIYRDYAPTYLENQIAIAKTIGAHVILTDFELIRKDAGMGIAAQGYNVGIGYAGTVAPLLAPLKASSIFMGSIFEGVAYSFDGPRVTYVKDYAGTRGPKFIAIFDKLGIKFSHPLACLSEIHTTRIVSESDTPHSSCHNFGVEAAGRAGVLECGRCPKCLRKFGIMGRMIAGTNDNAALIRRVRTRRPLHAPSSFIYGFQKAGYGIPQVDAIDVSFCERYCSKTLKALVHPAHKSMIVRYLKSRGIERMIGSDYTNIRRMVAAINKQEFYE